MQQCLAATGVPVDLVLWLSVAGLLLVAGIALALTSRRSRAARGLTLLAVGTLGVLLLGVASPAPAQAAGCPDDALPPVTLSSSSPVGGLATSLPSSSTTGAVAPTGSSISSAPTSSTTSSSSSSTSDPATSTSSTEPSSTPTTSTVTVSPTTGSTEPEPPCSEVNDKSLADTDGDGVPDRCDLDSDNDGILDSEEDLNNNARFEDDDVDGDLLIIATLGDGVSSYLDLDSDNDGVLDLMEGRPFTPAQIDLYDSDHNGILDASLSFGTNGLADVLETAPDSGILLPALAAARNTDGDDKPDFVDLKSNGSDYDLYAIGRDDLDLLGGGFITPIDDADSDGILAGVDTDSAVRGAPGSPLSPSATP